MTVITLSIILFLIFTVLGGFHFYWFFGGKWGVESVIPTKSNDPITLSIPKLATLMVGFILISFGLIYLLKSGFVPMQVPNWLMYGYWIIPSLFTLRAIGEFRYVGFFKKIRNTKFAKADSTIFSPLCLIIGGIGILLELLK